MKETHFQNLISSSRFEYVSKKQKTIVQWYLQDNLFREITILHPYKAILGIEFVKFIQFNYTLLIVSKFDVLVVSLPKCTQLEDYDNLETVKSDNESLFEIDTEQDEFIEFNVEFPFPISSFKNFYNGLIAARDLEFLTEDSISNLTNDDIFFIFDDPFNECSFIQFQIKNANFLSLLGCSKNFLNNGILILTDKIQDIQIYKLSYSLENNENKDYRRGILKNLTAEYIFYNTNSFYEAAIECQYIDELSSDNEIYFFISLKNEKRIIEVFLNTIGKVTVTQTCYNGSIKNICSNRSRKYITFENNKEFFIYNPFYGFRQQQNINSSISVPNNFFLKINSTHVKKFFLILENLCFDKQQILFFYEVIFCSIKANYVFKKEIEIFEEFMLLLAMNKKGPYEFFIDPILLAWKDELTISTTFFEWIKELMLFHEELVLDVLETETRQKLAKILLKCGLVALTPKCITKAFFMYYLRSCISIVEIDSSILITSNQTLDEKIAFFIEAEILQGCISKSMYHREQNDFMLYLNDPLDIMQSIYYFASSVEEYKQDANLSIANSTAYKFINVILNKDILTNFDTDRIFPRVYKIIRMIENFLEMVNTGSNMNILANIHIDEHLLSTLPVGVSLFIKKLSIAYEEKLFRVPNLNDSRKNMLFFRKDLKKTTDSLNNIKSSNDLESENDFNIANPNFLLAASILAFMLPIRNNSLFDNKINYSDRDLVKIDCFLKQLSKPIGWGFLLQGANSGYIFNNEEKLQFDSINYSIASVFDENNLLKNSNYSKYIPMQFINKADFQTGVTKAIQFPSDLPGLDFLWVMNNKPKVSTAQYGGFLYGLGLQGYLKNLEEWQIYNIIVNKYTPVSIGMLLGITSSNRETCNKLVTKLLGIHLEQSLPSKSIDLNHHYTLQIASVLSFGLLYLASADKKVSKLMSDCLMGKVAINGSYRYNESYSIAAGVSLGLINLNNNNKNSNQISDAILADSLLDIIQNKKTDFIIGPLLAMCLMFVRTENISLINKLDKLFKGRSNEFDLQINFYYHFVRALILWEEITDLWMENIFQKFLNEIDAFENPFHMSLIPIYYELVGCLQAYSIKNVGMRSAKLKETCLFILDRLLTMVKLDGITSYNMKIFLKHISAVCNILLEVVSLNYCGSADVDILKRCKFILTEDHISIKDYFIRDFQNEDVKLKDSKLNFLYSSDANFNEFLNITGQKSNSDDTDHLPVDEDADLEEEIYEEEEEEGGTDAAASGDNTPANNALDKKPDYIEKIGLLSEAYSLYSSASFSMGLLLLGGGKKMIDIYSDNKNLAFLILSMLPVTNQFPFELQELRHLYLMCVKESYLIVKDCDTNVPVSVDVLCKMKDKQKGTVVLKSPSSLMNLQVIDSIEINHKDYYRIVIDSNELKKKSNNKEFVIYIQSRNKDNNENRFLNNKLNGFERYNSNEDAQFKDMLLNEQKLRIRNWNLDLLTISQELTSNNLELWKSRK